VKTDIITMVTDNMFLAFLTVAIVRAQAVLVPEFRVVQGAQNHNRLAPIEAQGHAASPRGKQP
jgi:hypothetical protein